MKETIIDMSKVEGNNIFTNAIWKAKLSKYTSEEILNTPLKLEMFLLLDSLGNSLLNEECSKEELQKAEEKVIFEWQDQFKYWDNSDMAGDSIRDLLNDGEDYYFKNKINESK
jgi:hypothetical protein